MSSNIQPVSGAFEDPVVFTMITPVVTANASGGAVKASANAKFMTNLPLDRAMAITQIDWNHSYDTFETLGAGSCTHWNWVSQITEALARAETAADPLNVGYDYHERYINIVQSTAASISAVTFTPEVYETQVMRHPWLTVAQQLNLVVSVFPQSDNSKNGPKVATWCKLYFKLLNLDANLRSYLATRIQISSQA